MAASMLSFNLVNAWRFSLMMGLYMQTIQKWSLRWNLAFLLISRYVVVIVDICHLWLAASDRDWHV